VLVTILILVVPVVLELVMIFIVLFVVAVGLGLLCRPFQSRAIETPELKKAITAEMTRIFISFAFMGTSSQLRFAHLDETSPEMVYGKTATPRPTVESVGFTD
jgi:hypothetical protein